MIPLLMLVIGGVWATQESQRHNARMRGLETAVEREVTDSLALESELAEYRVQDARNDSLRQRTAAFSQLEEQRRIWPRLLDEISDAMPAQTWLVEIAAVESADTTGQGPGFLLHGRTQTADALSLLMRNLESSRYIRGVRLVAMEQDRLDGMVIQRFRLEAAYRDPAVARATTAAN
jgi:Tfp pilus assembly protein PilN